MAEVHHQRGRATVLGYLPWRLRNRSHDPCPCPVIVRSRAVNPPLVLARSPALDCAAARRPHERLTAGVPSPPPIRGCALVLAPAVDAAKRLARPCVPVRWPRAVLQKSQPSLVTALCRW